MHNETFNFVLIYGMLDKMEVLENINKVFAFNLRKHRGKRTQAEIAEAVGLSLRGYQRLEKGTIPRTRRLTAQLAVVLRVPETALFLDPDLIRPSPQEALMVISDFVKKNLAQT